MNNTPYIMDVPGRSLDAAPPGSSPYGLQQKHTFFNCDTMIHNTHHLGTLALLTRPVHVLESLLPFSRCTRPGHLLDSLLPFSRCTRESSTPSLCSSQRFFSLTTAPVT